MAINFSKYGTVVGSNKPIQGSLPAKTDFSAYGTPVDDSTLEGGITKSLTGQDPGYFERVGQQYMGAAKDIISNVKQAATPTQSTWGDIKQLGSKTLQSVGEIAGTVFAPITEAPVVKPAIEKAGSVISQIPGVADVVTMAKQLADKHPELAKNIEAMINLLTVGAGKTVEQPLKSAAGEVMTGAGKAIEKSGLESINIAKNKFVQDLVGPIKTKAVKEAEVARTTETGIGPFKKSVITPTSAEARAAEEVSKIPNVKEGNTYQQNYNHISEANLAEAKKLEADIIANDFVIPKREVLSRMQAAKDTLSKSPVIVGDAEKTADKLIAGASEIIARNEGKGSGLLKAKKEYDQWVLSQKPKAFDGATENAFTLANREIRNVFKDILDTNAPNAQVKTSLAKQSSLYEAMDNIAPKAAQEADTAIMRAFQKISEKLGTKNRAVQILAAAAGIGGLGAAATFAPAAAVLGGAGFVMYKAGKLILKPQVRTAIGKLLQQFGHLLNPEDKKILQDAITSYSEMPNKQGGFVANPLAATSKKSKLVAESKPQIKQGKLSSTNDTTSISKKSRETGDKIAGNIEQLIEKAGERLDNMDTMTYLEEMRNKITKSKTAKLSDAEVRLFNITAEGLGMPELKV